MSRLLCTITATDAISYDCITVPRIYAYAKRCGADFMAVTQPSFGEVWDATNGRAGSPSMWKLPLLRWFSKQPVYSTLVFVDADVFIRKDSPSIFDAVEGDGFHVARDANSDPEVPRWTQWARERYGLMESPPDHLFYANAGVWRVSRAAAKSMVHSMGLFPEIHTRYMEQDYIQLMANHAGVIRELPLVFNIAFPCQVYDPNAGHFLHVCGLSHQDKHDWLVRIEAMGI